MKTRRLAAARLHLGKHGNVRLCHGALCLVLCLCIPQRACKRLAPLLDPCHLLVKIGVVFLQILLIRGRELSPLPQLLTDQRLAVRICLVPRFLRLTRLHPAGLDGRTHRLCEAFSRLDAILHLATQIAQLRIVPNAPDSLEYCHNITSV